MNAVPRGLRKGDQVVRSTHARIADIDLDFKERHA
jgi:hypothetical protein